MKVLISAAAILFLLLSLMSPPFAQQAESCDAISRPADPRCAHRGESGPCKAMIESWFYNPGSESCKAFYWGGCGEPRPFSSESECLVSCSWGKYIDRKVPEAR